MKKLNCFLFRTIIQKSLSNVLYIFILTVVILPSNVAQAQKSEAEKVKERLFEYTNAMLKADTRTMENILADEHVFIGYQGSQSSKDEIIAAFASENYKLIFFKPDDVKLRVYGKTAIINIKALIKERYNDSSWETNVIVTQVWIKDSGKWKLVSEHVSRQKSE